MQFITIMGRYGSGKSAVENQLEKLGFKRSISYTTREPEIRNGKQEINGKEYIFVTKDKFMELYEKGVIIEYEEFGKHLYGTPRPYGAKNFVAVVQINGFRSLKGLYNKQVIGIYLKCDRDIALQRALKRDCKQQIDERVLEKINDDEKSVTIMEAEADLVINANQDLNNVVADILKGLKEINNESM